MLIIVENIVARLLLAIIPATLWTFFSFLIAYGLYKIKGKDIPDAYMDMSSYFFVTNYIIITILLIFFYRENLNLF